MDKPQIIGHVHKALSYTLYDCKWVPCSARFVVLGSHARGTGAMQLYEVERTDVTLVHEVEKPKSFKCGTFGASSLEDRCLATGDFEGNLQIWDLERWERPIYNVKGHEGIINAIDGIGGLGVGEGAAELATAGRDGAVKVWDPRQPNEPVACIEPASDKEVRRDCWSVAFGNAFNASDRCVVAGYDNGDVKLLDLRAMRLRWEENVRNGVCSVQFDRSDIEMNKLAVATLEGGLHVFDMRAHQARVTEKVTSGATVWAVRHCPGNRDVLMTAGGSGALHLWQYHYPAKRIVTEGSDGDSKERGVPGTLELLQNITMSSQPISSFDWSRDKQGLAVCTSFDQTLRVLIVTRLNTL